MAARSIGTLTVSFGLVAIPVKLYSATEASKAITFNMLHKTCGSRLKQQYVCVKEEVIVPREDMAKGYEFAKDQYVMFSPEELKALEETGTHMAEITEFVPIEAVDPVYFDKAYYLAPDKGGAKPYALLASALRESKRCALGRWAARGKQYIVMIRPVEDGAASRAGHGHRTQEREENLALESAGHAPIRRPRRREATAHSPQHHPRPRHGGIRHARARAAQCVGVFLPGPDRAAHRAGARGCEGSPAPHHPIGEGAAPAPARRDAALGAQHRRGGRPRGGEGGRQPLAGRIRAITSLG